MNYEDVNDLLAEISRENSELRIDELAAALEEEEMEHLNLLYQMEQMMSQEELPYELIGKL